MNTATEHKEDTAVIAVTKRGTATARRLAGLLPGSRLYLPEKFAGKSGEAVPFASVREAVAGLFQSHRYLVLVMAAGIAVRSLAGEMKDKRRDPGVVVLDEAGTYCISLLSGHLGGANELAEKISSLIGAQPVVTTASDVQGTLSLDLLGREYGWDIEEKEHLTAAAAALVNGEPVGLCQETGEPDWWPESGALPDNLTVYRSLAALIRSDAVAALVISDRLLNEETRLALPETTIVYRPKSLVVGIGCNRGTSAAAIAQAVGQVLASHGLSAACIRTIATIDMKKDEPGLEKYARERGVPLEFHERDVLRKTKVPSEPSAAALRHVGTPSVCEAAALLSSRMEELLVPKVKVGRAITVAVARYAFPGRIAPERGRLFLIGTGPGSLKQMTFAARDALDRCDVVIGYKTYLNFIKTLLGHKRVIATGMGGEIDRVKTALDLARQGNTVALVSGGDSGIYGMAGPAGELLRHAAGNVDVTVVPGVPALVAGASLLGSPISGDFTAVSLSDYLVPWEEITKRLDLAAQGSFVLALYNPQSRQRQRQLAEAVRIISRHRAPSTPAGIVTNAYRSGQTVTVTDLAHLPEQDIGMNSIVIIGNDTTFVAEGRMVTPRGYYTKYTLTEERI